MAGEAVELVLAMTVVSVEASGDTSLLLHPAATRIIAPAMTGDRQPHLHDCLAKNMKNLVTMKDLGRPMVKGRLEHQEVLVPAFQGVDHIYVPVHLMNRPALADRLDNSRVIYDNGGARVLEPIGHD